MYRMFKGFILMNLRQNKTIIDNVISSKSLDNMLDDLNIKYTSGLQKVIIIQKTFWENPNFAYMVGLVQTDKLNEDDSFLYEHLSYGPTIYSAVQKFYNGEYFSDKDIKERY